MRAFLISFLSLALLSGIWYAYETYSDEKLNMYIATIEEKILPAIEAENWSEVETSFKPLESAWNDYRKKAVFFFDTISINEADYTLARVKYYIKAKDVSNAGGELACLGEQLKLLGKNESFLLENVF